MVEKHIKSVLKNKLEKWIKTIDEPQLQQIARDNAIVTGGAIVSLINSEEPHDFDVYFRTKEAAANIANYYAQKWNNTTVGKPTVNTLVDNCIIENDMAVDIDSNNILSAKEYKNIKKVLKTDRVRFFIKSDGIAAEKPINNEDKEYEYADQEMEDEKPPFRPVFFSSNAVSLADKIQLIVRFYGSPANIHETFDFVHTKGYYDLAYDLLVIPKEVYEAVINKVLIYTGSQYPVCSLFRIRKFIERGWTINAGQILKMAFQVSELDLSNIDVLEDQLIGVDSSFFNMLIEQLQRQKEGGMVNISSDYIASIIDKVF